MNRIRDELRSFMTDMVPSMMITFAFKRMVSIDEMQSAISHYFNQLQSKVLGRGWAKHAPEERPRFIGVAEHTDRRQYDNPHVHGVLDAPTAYRRWIEGPSSEVFWHKSGKWCGSIDASPLTQGADRAVDYITKGLWTPNDQSKVVLYVPEPPKIRVR